jgi:PAS domain-containing protein
LIGKNDYDFFPKEQADFFTNIDKGVLKENKVLDIPEEPIATKFKGIRWLHTKKIPLLFVDGVPQYLLGISLDITEKKIATDQIKKFNEELEQRVKERTAELEKTNLELLAQMKERARAEESMRISEEKYRFLSDAIPQIIWTMNPDGTLDHVNKYGNDYLGSDLMQLNGWEWTGFFIPMIIKTLLIS